MGGGLLTGGSLPAAWPKLHCNLAPLLHRTTTDGSISRISNPTTGFRVWKTSPPAKILVPMAKLPDQQQESLPGTTNDEGDGEEQSLSFLQIAGSVLAAAFGVQSSRNRERDFSRGKVSHFVVAGVIFTAAFVLIMVVVVNLVLGSF